MKVTKELIDKEIELTKMKLELVGSANLSFVLSILTIITSLGVSFNWELLGYWVFVTLLIIFGLGVWWMGGFLKVFRRRPKRIKTQKIETKFAEGHRYNLEIAYVVFKNIFYTLEVLMIPSFVTVVLYYFGIIDIGKEYLLIRSKSFIVLYGAIIGILPFIVKSTHLVLLERTRDVLTLPEQIWTLVNQQPMRNIILLLILGIVLLVVYPIIWFYVTFLLPTRFLLHYLWNITSKFERMDLVGILMISLLQLAVAYFVFNYLNKRQVITNLTQALLELINMREALLLEEDTFGDTNLEARFVNSIKYSHFKEERLFGLFPYYVPAPNVLYLKWLEEKRKLKTEKDYGH